MCGGSADRVVRASIQTPALMNRELILHVLDELSSDADYQALLWSGKIEGVQASFIEAVCGLFNDSGLGRELDRGSLEITYSPALCQLARYLRESLKMIDGDETPEEIVAHLATTWVRETARELRILFLAESRATSDASA